MAPPPEGMGDVALPLFRWAKLAGLSPQELGTTLADGFPLGETLTKVEGNAGFLNFHASPGWLLRRTLQSILALGDSYGHAPPKGKRVCVEHTSANPTGQLHVGRSRNGIVGDTYARALKAAGYDVTVQFYVDDIGRQAATLVWIWSRPVSSWPLLVREKSGVPVDGVRPVGMKPDEWRGKPYPSASEVVKADPSAAKEVSDLVARFERGEIPEPEYRRVPLDVLEGTQMTLSRIGITFDEFVWESGFILNGAVNQAIARLEASPAATREEGALAIDASGQGLPEKDSTIYLRRSDGSTLYVARDVAYHLEKLARFDRVIDVLGEDHKLHFRALLVLLKAAGEQRKPEVFHYSFVGLEGGKMSTRAGRVVTLDGLLDDARDAARKQVLAKRSDLAPDEAERIAERVGAGAVRFHILAVQPDKAITFRMEEALSLEGKSGPFLQYAHARASSLLHKAKETEEEALTTALAGGDAIFVLPSDPDPRELALVKALSRFPSLVERVAENGTVHLLALYPYEVAERLNEFYQAVRVLGGEPAWLPFRLALVAAARQVLHNALELIGVEPLERM